MTTLNVSGEALNEIYARLLETIDQGWQVNQDKVSPSSSERTVFPPLPTVVGRPVSQFAPMAEAVLSEHEDTLATSSECPPESGDHSVPTMPHVSHPTEVEDREAEARHFQGVCHAFGAYEEMALTEIRRIERNFNSLSPEEAALLQTPIQDRMDALRKAVATNQQFLNLLISQDLDIVDYHEGCAGSNDHHCMCHGDDSMHYANTGDPIEPGCAIEDNEVSSMNMYKVRSTLKQFAREWSAERASERAAAFNPLIGALEKYKPLETFKKENGRRPWVLCPGSGLGRLPFDVVCKGYSCQGNEFSYFMLLGSNFILNHAHEPNTLTIYPFCLNSSNRRKNQDHLQAVTIPDVSAVDAVAEGLDFSMCAGDFVEVYSAQPQAWDAVLTCFFIDTAKNVILYIHTIAHILPPGGLWANVGPLLYHFADSTTEISIELSWEEIRSIVVRYFDIVEEEWIDCYYTTPPNSMLQALYHCISFAALRNDVPVEPHFLRQNH